MGHWTFGNVATVIALCNTLHWMQMAMDQMCSKCEKHCFSHGLQKYPNLGTLEKFLNLGKFPKKFFCPNLFF